MDELREAVTLLLIVGGILLRADALIMLYLKGRDFKRPQGVLLALISPVVALVSFSYLSSRSDAERDRPRNNLTRIIVEIVLFIAAQLSAGWCFFYFMFIAGQAIPSGRAIGPMAEVGDYLPVHIAIILSVYSVILICLLSLFHREMEIGDLFKGKKILSSSLYGMAVLIPLILILSLLINLLAPVETQTSSSIIAAPDNLLDMIFLFIGLVLIAPLVEEIFFRGTLYAVIDRNLGVYPAILITSVVFSIMHFDPVQALPLFLLGILMGWLRSRSDSIIPSLVVHSANNLLALVLISS
ncbi:MAG: lysostaphin resistance A-like protein [Thermoplasmatota archaeon]